MFEAGAIVWRIQTVGKQVLKQDLQESEAAAKKTGEALGKTAKQTEEVAKKSEQATPKVKTLRQEIFGMSESAQAAASGVGRGMLLVSAAILAVTGLTVNAAKEWDTAWAGVTKTIDAPAEQLERIEGGLRGLTAELPASHQEIAAVAEAAGQLGVAAEDVVDFTRTMIDLGETTNLTSDEAATSLAQLMNIFQTAPEDVDNLGSAIVALGNNGASTERDIVQMSQRIAGAAKIIGLSEGETLGLANALASVGIEAEAGGSSVSAIMIDIANAVSSKGPKLLEWAKLAGLSADEFARKYRTAPAEALALVIEGMGRLNDEGGDVFATLSALGQTDVRVTRSLLGLAGSGDMLRKSLQLGNDAWAENTALQAEAEKRYETTAAKLDMARNSVVDLAIDLGEYLLPAVEAVAGGISDFTGFLGDLPEPVQQGVVVTGLLVAGIMLLGGVLLVSIPKIVAFRVAVATLTTELPLAAAKARGFAAFMRGPWGIALAAAAIGVGVLSQYLNGMKASTEELEAAFGSAKSTSASLWSTLGKGTTEIGWARAELDKLQDTVDYLGGQDFNLFSFFGNEELRNTADRIVEVGKNLGKLVATDLPSAQLQFSKFAAETDGSEESLWSLLQLMPDYKSALIAAATDAGTYSESMSDAEKQQVLLKLAQIDTVGSSQLAAKAYLEAEDSVDQLQATLDKLIDTINKANGVGQDAVSANADYQESLASVAEYIAEAQKGTEGYTRSVDESTAAGSANADMFREQAEASQTAAEAQYQLDLQTMSGADATDKYIAALESGRQTLYDNILALTGSAEAAQILTDKVYGIPDTAEIDVLLDAAAASANLDAFLKKLTDIPNQLDIVINEVIKTTGADRGAVRAAYAQADGGRISFYADGGRENHVAQFARAGDYRVWAEPETGGEWYIPASPAKRGRSTMLLAEAANEFGYRLVPSNSPGFDSGGRAGAPAPRTSDKPQQFVGTLELVGGRAYITGIMQDELGSGY